MGKLQRHGTTFPFSRLPRDLKIRSLAWRGRTAQAPGVHLHAPPPLSGFSFGHYNVSTSRLIAILVGCGRGGGWILQGLSTLRLEFVCLGTFWVPFPHRVGVQGHFRAPCTQYELCNSNDYGAASHTHYPPHPASAIVKMTYTFFSTTAKRCRHYVYILENPRHLAAGRSTGKYPYTAIYHKCHELLAWVLIKHTKLWYKVDFVNLLIGV